MSEYRPIPSAEGKILAEKYAKDVVVILAIDHEHDMVHTTTFGKSPHDKEVAAILGERLGVMLGLESEYGPRIWYEDFRQTRAAEWKAEKDRLEARIRELEEQIGNK